jgi:two-component system, chemotaxis family, response regulator Rcp1
VLGPIVCGPPHRPTSERVLCWAASSEEHLIPARSQLVSPVQVLLVEDCPGDVRLTQEALQDANAGARLHVATDDVEAMDGDGKYRDCPRPDLILLDLNLPKLDGCEVLTPIKKDSALKAIPIVVLSRSAAQANIAKSYALRANCYLTKPLDLEDLDALVKRINEFWVDRVKFPQCAAGG